MSAFQPYRSRLTEFKAPIGGNNYEFLKLALDSLAEKMRSSPNDENLKKQFDILNAYFWCDQNVPYCLLESMVLSSRMGDVQTLISLDTEIRRSISNRKILFNPCY
jgi:hypothetical protein